MIIVALGSNVRGPWGRPAETLDQALLWMGQNGIKILARSSWIETKPYGRTDQPAFVNGAVHVKTALMPEDLLKMLHKIEVAAGRRRREKWGPRTLDLDLIAYNNVVLQGSDNSLNLNLPHDDLHNRSFVLQPIAELNPSWQHPVSAKTVTQMLDDLPKTDEIKLNQLQQSLPNAQRQPK